MRFLLLLFVLLQLPAPAEIRTGKWLRRGATSALCATSAIDAVQTFSAAGRHGVYESNALFRSSRGANVPLVIGVKALVCVGSVVMGERLPSGHGGYFTGLNMAGAGVNTFVILHNRRVTQRAGVTR